MVGVLESGLGHPGLRPDIVKGALSRGFCCFQLHSLLKSLPVTVTYSRSASLHPGV